MVRSTAVFGTLACLLTTVSAAPGTRDLTPEQLEADITTTALKSKSKQLQNIANRQASNGNRAFGTYGHNESVAYIYNTVKNTNAYDLEKHYFLAHQYTPISANLTVGAEVISEFKDIQYSPATPAEGVTGPLTFVPDLEAAPGSTGCTLGDFADADYTGKIVLIQRGGCNFAVKVQNAADAGAAGVIIYNNILDPLSARLDGPSDENVPVGSVEKPTGDSLVARLQGGEELVATLNVQSNIVSRWSANVIATSKSGDHNNIVFQGSHLDSVPAGPGLNDDGSGSILNLELAVQLAKYKLKNAVRFGWWSAEEAGIIGSTAYVDSLSDEERSKIALYLNYDMIASPNYVFAAYDGDNSAGTNSPNQPGPAGSAEIENIYVDYFAAKSLPLIPTSFNGRSDYKQFIAYGIPAGGLFTGAEGLKTETQVELFGGHAGISFDPNYHKIGDTYDNLNFTAFTTLGKAAANVLAQLIESTDPVTNPSSARRVASVNTNDELAIENVTGCFHNDGVEA